MTFDSGNNPSGSAILVPCYQAVSQPEEVVKEAEELWKAEQPDAPSGALGASWGCVGLLFRDEPPIDWLNRWSAAFQGRTSPVPPVDERGLLQLAWPLRSDGGLLELDFLLATATRQECTRPTTETIADAWIHQNDGQERYFFENVRHGIRTEADHAIWRRMEERRPLWLGRAADDAGIKILRSEVAGLS